MRRRSILASLLVAAGAMAQDATPLIQFVTAGPSDITSGLVGWWKMHEGSGTNAADSSGYGNTAILRGTATWTNTIYGNAVWFDGVQNTVNPAAVQISTNVNNLFTTNLTVNCWFYTLSFAGFGGDGVTMFAKNTTGYGGLTPPYTCIDMSLSLAGKTSCSIGDGATRKAGLGTQTYKTNTWYMASLTYDGVTLRTFINGIADPTSGTNAPYASLGSKSLPLFFGALCLSSYTDVTKGPMVDARIYNRALSQSELATLYANGPK